MGNYITRSSYLRTDMCSGRNVTWQYINSNGTIPAPYDDCEDLEKVLGLHCCHDGNCHPHYFDKDFERYEWKDWDGLGSPYADEKGAFWNWKCNPVWYKPPPIKPEGGNRVRGLELDNLKESYEKNHSSMANMNPATGSGIMDNNMMKKRSETVFQQDYSDDTPQKEHVVGSNPASVKTVPETKLETQTSMGRDYSQVQSGGRYRDSFLSSKPSRYSSQEQQHGNNKASRMAGARILVDQEVMGVPRGDETKIKTSMVYLSNSSFSDNMVSPSVGHHEISSRNFYGVGCTLFLCGVGFLILALAVWTLRKPRAGAGWMRQYRSVRGRDVGPWNARAEEETVVEDGPAKSLSCGRTLV